MPGISRDNDTAKGDLIPSQSTVYANGEKVIVDGDSVTPHDDGVHRNNPVMIAGSNKVFIGKIAVVNKGDFATCGHTSTGSSDVYVGD